MFSIFWIIASTIMHSKYLAWLIMAVLLMPGVSAQAEETPFPNIPFKVFAQFVKENFSSKITLSQVLLVLFTITDNTDLLNLHARQQNPEYPEENPSLNSGNSGWIRGLARAFSVLRSGLTRFFSVLGSNWNRNRFTYILRAQKVGPNRTQPVVCGSVLYFSRFSPTRLQPVVNRLQSTQVGENRQFLHNTAN